MAITYRDAGVDVEAGYEAVRLMKKHVASTQNDNVLQGIGSFGGFFDISHAGIGDPVLVAGTDGVGTKLKIAFVLNRHDTIGIDAVAMCVNDIVCQGAKPLFFLDYIANPKTEPEKVEQIVAGMAEGCRQSGCAIIGGETAEMPGFYAAGEYDVAGFSVGIVSKKKVINGQDIKAGDVLFGLPSSGVHSNGFSLVRKLFDITPEALNEFVPELNCTLGEELLRPTVIYVKPVLELIERVKIKGIAHMTGGGFIENIPRMFPEGLTAEIEIGSWPVLPIFQMMQQKGQIPDESIYNTFNMGIGMVLATAPEDAEAFMQACGDIGQTAYRIGVIGEGGEGVKLCR